MPSAVLTDAMLRSLAPGEKLTEYWDARVAGLCLRISPSGIRTWTFRYRPKDSSSFKRLGLGRYPEVGLAEARRRAEAKRSEVAGGADPQGERKARREADRRSLTLERFAAEYIERYAKPNKSSWRNDDLYLRAHVIPTWGAKKAKSIGRADAAALLDKIAKTAPISANRTHAVARKLFAWGVESGLVEANPFAGLTRRAKEVPKTRVLSPDEIRKLWGALEDDDISAALRFLLLTGLRPGEAAGAAIAELVEVENGTRARLEIPAERMKARRQHIMPLAPMALAVVRRQLDRATTDQAHIFPSRFAERGPIARHSVSQYLQRVIAALPSTGPDADTVARLKADPPTPHDFRRTTATGLAALGVPREDRLAVLAHAQSDVHGVHYDKYDRLAEKRRALELWERRIEEIIAPQALAANVVKIGGHR